jgi:hypothetical protein
MTTRTVAAGSSNDSFRQQKIALCRDIIVRIIELYFKDTLGQIIGLPDLYIRLLSTESGLNEITTANPVFSDAWWAKHMINKSPRLAAIAMVKIKGNTTDPFIREVCYPHGVGQVMGYHMVRGLTASNVETFAVRYKGKNVFELVKKVNGGTFLVNETDSAGAINANFSGPDALENGIRASLGLFAGKFDAFKNLDKAIKAYFGSLNPAARDANGTSPDIYLARVKYGSGSLAVANTNRRTNIQIANNLSTGPQTNSNNAAKSQWSC